jgi:hypothetical protein
MRVVLDRLGLRSALLNLTRIRDRLGSSHTSQHKSMQISFFHHDEWNVLHKSDARGTWRFAGYSSCSPCADYITVMRRKIGIRTNACVGSSEMQLLVCEACRTIAAERIQGHVHESRYYSSRSDIHSRHSLVQTICSYIVGNAHPILPYVVFLVPCGSLSTRFFLKHLQHHHPTFRYALDLSYVRPMIPSSSFSIINCLYHKITGLLRRRHIQI